MFPLCKIVLRKLKVELSYDPATPLPSIYPKEMKKYGSNLSVCPQVKR